MNLTPCDRLRWYGWKLHLTVSPGRSRIPLAAALTTANTADNTIAPQLLAPLPAEVCYILGTYSSPAFLEGVLDVRACAISGQGNRMHRWKVAQSVSKLSAFVMAILLDPQGSTTLPMSAFISTLEPLATLT